MSLQVGVDITSQEKLSNKRKVKTFLKCLSASEKENFSKMEHNKIKKPESKKKALGKIAEDKKTSLRRSKRNALDTVSNTGASEEGKTVSKLKPPKTGPKTKYAEPSKISTKETVESELNCISSNCVKSKTESSIMSDGLSSPSKKDQTLNVRAALPSTNEDRHVSDTTTTESQIPPRNVLNECNMLTARNAPELYWKDLAEQRRIALEEALKENESLYDQLTVLEVENNRLKSIVEEAENLTSIVKGILQ